jgi:hypothetical protein
VGVSACNWCHVTMISSAQSDPVQASDMVGVAIIGDRQSVAKSGMRWIPNSAENT